MAEWVLRCQLTSSWATIRPALSPFLDLLGLPSALSCVRKTPRRDQNGGNDTYTSSWVAGAVQLEEAVVNGTGNPRDGWDYNLQVALKAPELTLQITSCSWVQSGSPLEVMLEGSAEAFLALRQVLSTLGQDSTDLPYLAVQNIEMARGNPALQRSLLDAALKHGPPGSYGWRELLAIQATLEGPNLERRLLEAPEDWTAWQDAAAASPEQRPSGLTAELCLERAHRLMPEQARASTPAAVKRGGTTVDGMAVGTARTTVEKLAPLWESHPRWPGRGADRSEQAGRVGWAVHSHSLEPEATFPALVFQAARSLFPDACPVDAPPAYLKEPLAVGEAHVTGQTWARYSARGLAIVCQRDIRCWPASWKKASIRNRLSMKPDRQTLFTWLWDDVPGSEGLLLFVESMDKQKGHLSAVGTEAHWSGSPSFLARVAEALKAATPYPWVPVG